MAYNINGQLIIPLGLSGFLRERQWAHVFPFYMVRFYSRPKYLSQRPHVISDTYNVHSITSANALEKMNGCLASSTALLPQMFTLCSFVFIIFILFFKEDTILGDQMDQSIIIHIVVWRYEQNRETDVWENLLIAWGKSHLFIGWLVFYWRTKFTTKYESFRFTVNKLIEIDGFKFLNSHVIHSFELSAFGLKRPLQSNV